LTPGLPGLVFIFWVEADLAFSSFTNYCQGDCALKEVMVSGLSAA
jgi:hypothetical protein